MIGTLAKECIGNILGEKGEVFRNKLNHIVKQNKDIKVLEQVAKVLNGNENANLLADMGPAETAALKYCPLALVDLARSLSKV